MTPNWPEKVIRNHMNYGDRHIEGWNEAIRLCIKAYEQSKNKHCNHIFTRTMKGEKLYCNGCNEDVTELNFWFWRGYEDCKKTMEESRPLRGLDKQKLLDLWMNTKKHFTNNFDYHPEGLDLFIDEICSKFGVPEVTEEDILKELYLYEDHMQGHPGIISEVHFEKLAQALLSLVRGK